MIGAIRLAVAVVRQRRWWLLAASYLLVGALASCAGRSAVQRELRFNRALYAENLAAVRDTSRRLQLGVVALGDSLVLTERRAVQQQQRGDALDRALRVERRARVAVRLELPRVMSKTMGAAAALDSSGGGGGNDVRRAHFTIEQAWYSGSADVALPPAPERPQLSLDLGMRPIPLEVRLGCSARSASGVRRASATVAAPAWAKLTLTNVEQDVVVCSQPVTRAAAHRSLTTVLRERLAIVIGYGVSAGVWKPGPVLAAGVRLW